MRQRMIVRALPALAVLALLALAGAGPPPMMPAPPPLFNYCTQPTLAGGGSLTTILEGSGVTQPLPVGMTVAACSLRAEANGWTDADLRIRECDPLTLAPDPSAIALRAERFDPSRMNYYVTNSVPAVRFVPPIVTRSLSGVAEPPRQTIAIEVRGGSPSPGYHVETFFDASGNSVMPAASLVAIDGTRSPLPGAHPVIAHAICTGDADVQALRVAQSVRRTDATIPAGTQEIAQRFRVPEAVELRWIELAVASGPGSTQAGAALMPSAPNAVVGVVDGAVLGEPATTMPPTLVEALFGEFFYWEPAPRWASHVDFDHTITLQPGHDYWLYVRSGTFYQFLARTLTGGESADFSSRIGPMYARLLPTDAWGQVPSRALAFTIVGRPLPGLGVGAPRARDGIRMQISPNPTHELAEVTWSGAVGPVKLEVLDARGRRVATGEGGAAGTWSLTRGARGGAALPSGVYFVHARDSAGGHDVERVVIVR